MHRIKKRFFINALYLILCTLFLSCHSSKSNRIKIVFLDLLQDETLAQAKRGFFLALKDSGFTSSNMDILYRNAQNDQPSLLLACDYLISQNVNLIATNPTLSTITAVQKTKDIPVFMMVSPRPDIAKLTDQNG